MCVLLLLGPVVVCGQPAPEWAQLQFEPPSPVEHSTAHFSISIPLVVGATFEDLIDVSFDDDEMFIDARILGPPLGGVGDEVVTYRKQFVAPSSGTYQIRVRFENEFGPYVAFDGGELTIEGNVTSLGAVKVPAMGTWGLLGLAGLSLTAGLVLLQRQQS